MNISNVCLSTIVCCAATALCCGQDCAIVGHRDINLQVIANKIVTGIAVLSCPNGAPPDQCTSSIDTGWRVHPRAYHASQCDPFFLSDPGTFAQDGSGLPAGSTVGFNIRADLLYWNGSGIVQFGPVPNHETLRIKFGNCPGGCRTAGTGTGFVSGFSFATADSAGGLHVHLGYFLLGADGNSVPAQDVPACAITGDGIEPTPGLYLLQLEFKSNNGGIATSDPVWIVFNNSVSGCMDCVGIDYVGSQIAHDRPATDLDFDRHVDTNDFSRFAACVTGPGVLWTDPCCQYADFDHDGDIDCDDFALYQRCFSGASVTADPLCEN